jgi:hypothetical protein
VNILHVEDDVAWFNDAVRPELAGIGITNVLHAKSYIEAVQLLGQNPIDYVVLDLAIPYENLSEAADLSHGLNLGGYIKSNFPGTPILILTGQSTEEAVEQFVEDKNPTIFWDGKERDLVKIRKKRRLPEVVDLLEKAAADLAVIERIELNLTDGLQLDTNQQRIIKLFCKHHDGLAATVTSLDSGLSSSRVVCVELINDKGKPFHFALAKIDDYESVNLEHQNFTSHIQKLPVGSFPNLLNQYSAGSGMTKGIFFQFASKYTSDYFGCLIESDDKALGILQKTKPYFDNWLQGKDVKSTSVGDIRKLLCSDEKLVRVQKYLSHIDIEQFESKMLQANFNVQHADLHGKNILVSADLIPLIIDYGDVKIATSVLDAVTLELSLFFHPDIKDRVPANLDIASNWFNDKKCTELSPFPKSADFLRLWALESAFLKRDYVATVYAYSVRQLTYDGTNKEFAAKLIESAVAAF